MPWKRPPTRVREKAHASLGLSGCPLPISDSLCGCKDFINCTRPNERPRLRDIKLWRFRMFTLRQPPQGDSTMTKQSWVTGVKQINWLPLGISTATSTENYKA